MITFIQNIFHLFNLIIIFIQNISQIFYNFAVGFGLLLAGGVSIKALIEWRIGVNEKRKKDDENRKKEDEKKKKEIRNNNKILELKAKYHKKELGKTFQLIKSSAKPGYIYLLDLTTNIKHHVGSSTTFHALEYNSSMVVRVSPEKFNAYKEGDKILIE